MAEIEYHTFDGNPTDKWRHILVVPHGSAIFGHRGDIIDPVIEWLIDNVGQKEVDWRLKSHKFGRGVLIKFKQEDLALAFKIMWSS